MARCTLLGPEQIRAHVIASGQRLYGSVRGAPELVHMVGAAVGIRRWSRYDVRVYRTQPDWASGSFTIPSWRGMILRAWFEEHAQPSSLTWLDDDR